MMAKVIHAGPADLTRQPGHANVARAMSALPRSKWLRAAVLAVTYLIVILAPALPSLHEPIAWAGFALVSALLCIAWLVGPDRDRLIRLPRTHSLGLWLGGVLMAAPWAYHALTGPGWERDGLPVAIAIAGSIAFLFAAIQAGRSDRIILNTSTWVFLVAVVVAGHSLLTGQTGPVGHPGLSGPFANRNSFALFLSFGILAGIYLRRAVQRDITLTGLARALSAALTWLGIGILFLCVGLTLSRVGTLSLVAGLMVLSLTARGRERRVTMRAFGVAAVFGALSIAPLAERFSALARDLATRRALYDQVIEMIRTEPVWGYGPGRFALVYQKILRPPVDPGRVWDHAHSGFLNLWVEFGVIAGSVPIIAGLFLAGWLLVRAWRHRCAAAATGLAALVVTAGHALTDFSIENPANTVFLLALIALGFRPDRRPDKGANHVYRRHNTNPIRQG